MGSKPTRRAAVAVVAGLVTSAAANIPKNVIEADDAQIAAKIKTEGTQTRTALNAATVHGIQTPDDPIQTALNAQSVQVVNRGGLRVYGTGSASTDVSTLQDAMSAAVSAGVPLEPRGAFTVNATLLVPSGLTADFSKAKITQTKALTPLFRIDSKSDVNIRNLTAQGLTSDYVNNSGVYGASAIYLAGTTSRVTITDSTLLGFAGSGVYIGGAVSDVIVARNRMTGAGSAHILNNRYNFSGGIVTETGATRWSAMDNEISDFTQGIVTGDNMTDIRVTGNYVHDIPGQHGFYLETINGGVIANNIVHNVALCGMKIQVGATTVQDANAITITGNTFIGVGAQGILLTNPPGGTPRLRNIAVVGNVVRDATGTAIEANNCVGLHVADNVVHNAATGLNLTASTQAQIVDNHFSTMGHHGIRLDATDVQVAFNRIIDPASANNASTEFGIQVLGTSAEVTLRGNRITDAHGNMRYGIYVSAGTQASMDIVDNLATGATDYGWRGMTSAARTFRGNTFSGATGAMLIPPTNFTAIASPTADTASLKTAVDAIRSTLTANGITQ